MQNKPHRPHYYGHRQRQKDKFLKANSGVFSEYELLELLLFWSIPRRDVKLLAKKLLQNCSLDQLFSKKQEELEEILGEKKAVVLSFKFIRLIIDKFLDPSPHHNWSLNSWDNLVSYLTVHMINYPTEQFRVLFLNKKNILIYDQEEQLEFLLSNPITKIVKDCLFYEAGAIVLIHHRPELILLKNKIRSFKNDELQKRIEITGEITKACKQLNVTLLDHIVTTKNDFFSFRMNGLI